MTERYLRFLTWDKETLAKLADELTDEVIRLKASADVEMVAGELAKRVLNAVWSKTGILEASLDRNQWYAIHESANELQALQGESKGEG
jgi:hypothetical protein